MDALILAGGSTPPEFLNALPPESRDEDRALVSLHGRPMVEYTLEALRECPDIDRIAVIGTPRVLELMRERYPQVLGVEAGPRMIANGLKGCRALREQPNSSRQALITTSDVPLASAQTYSEFVRGFREKKLDASYAIVEKATCEAQFPGGKRTYARLKDGTFTAGNCVIVEVEALETLSELFEKFYRARKNPIAMARLFGGRFLWRAITRQLSVPELEEFLSNLVKSNFRAVEMQDAAIAFDVDKLDDFLIAQKRIEAAGRSAAG